jgi:hypothetical protein
MTVTGTSTLGVVTATTVDATTDFTIDGLVITADTITNDAALSIVSTGLTLDASLDIALSADGGNVTMDDGTTTVFDFVVDSSKLKIMDSAQVANYCSLQTSANGATTLTTVDADAASAHLIITADGNVDIDSAGAMTLDSGAGILLEPAAGSVITLDGVITIDAGVVAGATSVTSTNFDGIIGAGTARAGTFALMSATSGDFGNGNIGNVGDIDCDTISVADAANGLQIQFGGNTTTNKITLTDNLAEALTIEQGGNNYILFETTDDGETIEFGSASGAVCDFLATGGSTGDGDFTVAGYAQFAGIVEVDGVLDCDSTSTFAGLATLAAGATLSGGDLTVTSGDITCTATDSEVKAGSFVTYSDAALKTNVETVDNAMDMIQGLRGVSYDLKANGAREYGFIAQEVNEILPEVVSTSGDLMGIDYTRITSLLVEAVKTQQAEIIALQKKLDK